MERVTSVRNPALKEIRKAIARGSLTDRGLCVAEGFHLLEEALRSGLEIDSIYGSESAESRIGEAVPGHSGVRAVIVPNDVFDTIASTETTQGVVALVRPPGWTLADLFRGTALVAALDGIQDPGNAGTIVRAAEAFGATGVVFLKGSVDPYNPKALRAAAGSTFRVPLVYGIAPSVLLNATEQSDVKLFALVQTGSTPLGACPLERPCVIVAGSEGRGVGEELLARAAAARIPTRGVESLNAAMAASIALYEAARRRGGGVVA